MEIKGVLVGFLAYENTLAPYLQSDLLFYNSESMNNQVFSVHEIKSIFHLFKLLTFSIANFDSRLICCSLRLLSKTGG